MQSILLQALRERVLPIAMILLGAMVLGAGCIHPGQPQNPAPPVDSPAEPPKVSNHTSETVFSRAQERLAVEFVVHRYSAAPGTFSSEAGVWKVVTGPLPDAATLLRLKDNGFRAAIGQESDREPLRNYLSQITGLQSVMDHAVPDARRSVEVEMGACPERTVVFYYGRTGNLRGLDFEQGKAKLCMNFELRGINLRDVAIQATPAVEEPQGPPKWILTEQGPQEMPEERCMKFDDLAFGVVIPEGGFLMVGPTETIQRRPLVGRSFFQQSSEKDGLQRESVYIISPVVRTFDDRARRSDQ